MKRDGSSDKRFVYQHYSQRWLGRLSLFVAALGLGLLTLLLPAVQLVKAPEAEPLLYRGVTTTSWAPRPSAPPPPPPPTPPEPELPEPEPEAPSLLLEAALPAAPAPSAPQTLRLPLHYDFQVASSAPDLGLNFVVDRSAQHLPAVAGAAPISDAAATEDPQADPGDALYASDEIEQAPQVREQSKPLYPYRARVRGVEGHVDLCFVVDEKGRVGEMQLLGESPPGVFAEAAQRALRRWLFTPGMHGGQPVRTLMRIRIRFDLED